MLQSVLPLRRRLFTMSTAPSLKRTPPATAHLCTCCGTRAVCHESIDAGSFFDGPCPSMAAHTIAAVSDDGRERLEHDDEMGLGAQHGLAAALPSAAVPTALPSVLARVAAFAAIVIAAVCGGLAGYSSGTLLCTGGCAGPTLAGAAIGALGAAAGVAALAALVLRSMSEWRDQASVTRRKHETSTSTGEKAKNQ